MGSAFEAFIRKSPKFEAHVSLEAMKYFDKVMDNRLNGKSKQGENKFLKHITHGIGTYCGEVDSNGNASGFGIWK